MLRIGWHMGTGWVQEVNPHPYPHREPADAGCGMRDAWVPVNPYG